SDSHSGSSAGTTSMCPERTSPGREKSEDAGSGPTQTTRFALEPSGESWRSIRQRCGRLGWSRYSQRKSASGRLLFQLVVSKQTSRARRSASERAAAMGREASTRATVATVLRLRSVLIPAGNGSTLPYMEALPLTREQAIASLHAAEADIRSLGV